MDLKLTEEQTLIIDIVRKFVREEIVPLEATLDPDADALEPEDAARLRETTKAMGLFGLDIPVEYGGPEVDLITRTLLAIEMAQHRAGLYAPCYGVFGAAGLFLGSPHKSKLHRFDQRGYVVKPLWFAGNNDQS